MMKNRISNLTDDQSAMVRGIAKILLGVKDIDNRMKLAKDQIQKFKEEEIIFNYAGFLSMAGLDNSGEDVYMDILTQPTHRVHKESTKLKSLLPLPIEEAMVRSVKDIVHTLIPKDTFGKFADDPSKNREWVNSLSKDMMTLLNRFYKEHDINVVVKL